MRKLFVVEQNNLITIISYIKDYNTFYFVRKCIILFQITKYKNVYQSIYVIY